MVQQLQHPVVGNIQLPRTPISFASPPTSILGEEIKDSKNKDQQGISILPPPMLGENTREILHNTLQMDHQLIQQLEKDKVIECWENIM
jgi:crotonobetainyl-CoA:carnitine CoA-transferase CaiB-like acyl-CoA transferase